MDVAEVKLLLNKRTDEDDAYIAAVLPFIEDAVRSYLNKPFLDDATGKDTFPGMVKLAIAKWVQGYTVPAGVQSQGMGSLSFGYAQGGAMPAEVKAMLDQYARNSRGAGSFGFIPMPSARPNIGPYRG